MDPQSTQDQGTPMAQPPQSADGGPSLAVPAVEPPLVPIATQPQQPALDAPAASSAIASIAAAAQTPAEAADNDVIEVEWVHKAKQIVSATHDDPFKQVIQLNQLKADYMQKRYNKTVKLPDA